MGLATARWNGRAGIGRHAAVAACGALTLVIQAPRNVQAASGRDSESAPLPISWSAALDAAGKLVELRIAESDLDVATAQLQAAGRPPDLGISLATRSVTARESVGLSLPIPWLGLRSARLAAGNHEKATAEWGIELARLQARRDLGLAWIALWVAEQRADLQHEAADRAEQNEAAIAALFEAGRVAAVDLKRAGAEAALSKSDLVGAEEGRRRERSRLALLLGIGAGSEVVTAGAAPTPTFELDVEMLRARAQAANPQRRAAALRLVGAEAAVRLARAEGAPAVALEAGADFNDPTQPGTDKSIGLSLTVPFDRQPKLRAAIAARERSALELQLAEREIESALQSACSEARAARQRLAAFDAAVLPADREAAELSQLSYREGRAALFVWLEAERQWNRDRLDRLDALATALAADVELGWLTGEVR